MISNICASEINWQLDFNVKTFPSVYSRKEHHVKWPGNQWKAELIYNNLTYDEVCELRADLADLHGVTGSFTLHHMGFDTLRGTGTGAPVTSVVTLGGKALVTNGWGANQIVLKKGDYFSVNGELKVVTADAQTNGGGGVTVLFAPPLHRNVPAGTPLELNRPSCTMRLRDNNQLNFSCRPGQRANITISCVEVV
ncbi:hypothetical protein K6Y31_20700 [Motilimonas cestriensis]|uniref:Uncharacterized protein n=1 Tax=Motilimonas cestriensis TaxID=2742685 RepID=A0ABS8WFS5_9GAMM|nr:hypothetical protein [Motilimonas cestriensis]MCE2597197.1 hypothetical protein [Motilimonas cestriensis]